MIFGTAKQMILFSEQTLSGERARCQTINQQYILQWPAQCVVEICETID